MHGDTPNDPGVSGRAAGRGAAYHAGHWVSFDDDHVVADRRPRGAGRGVAVRHRHLDIAPGKAPEALPAVAVVDLLDRGDLDDWAGLLAAVAADPHGPLAARVEELVEAFPMYGTSALWQAWLRRCRRAAR